MDSLRHEQFARAFVQHQDRVYGYIVTMLPSRHDAEDVFQQTSLILWQKWDQFVVPPSGGEAFVVPPSGGEDPLKPELQTEFLRWACGIARNEVRNFLRRRRRDRVVLSEKLLDNLAEVRLEAQPLLEERRSLLAGCMKKLDFIARELLDRCYAGRESIKQIALQFRTTPNAPLSPPASDPAGIDGVYRAGDEAGGRPMSQKDAGKGDRSNLCAAPEGPCRQIGPVPFSGVKLPPADSELARLVESMCDGTITPAEGRRLESLLAGDREAQLFYVAYLDLHAQVQWMTRDGGDAECGTMNDELSADAAPVELPDQLESPAGEPLIPPIVIHTSAFSSRPSFVGGWVFSYGVATLLTGLAVLISWGWKVSHDYQLAPNSPLPTPLVQQNVKPEIEYVGRITGTVDCRWADPQDVPPVAVPLGRKYELASGLVEIAYDSGATSHPPGPVHL